MQKVYNYLTYKEITDKKEVNLLACAQVEVRSARIPKRYVACLILLLLQARKTIFIYEYTQNVQRRKRKKCCCEKRT